MYFTNRERNIINYHLILSFLIHLYYMLFLRFTITMIRMFFNGSATLYELTQSDLFMV